ncbi:nucleotidyltransferase family protein [Lentimicrobium sp. S6]|uniref:nucleotidyltransferase family protein n=1 Tax=Lentimicrobium sp. S6 TaxID=2735872 RepID=UPI0015570810|nr:nucleotidyltransferase family protein [Lentimicrobium sp. S6]NPD46407.1 NTP transferase domain-containing protein [Lentimicrobium sp. S6]
MIKEAIILAGGLGTRLKGVVNDIPKPMAPINGIPFLKYLLEDVHQYGIERIILAVGYKWEVIQDYFGQEFMGMKIIYAIEHEPLGTGGGIKNAMAHLQNKDFFLLNGDTFFKVDLRALETHYQDTQSDLCLSLKAMTNFDRYGTVTLKGNQIIAFQEKKQMEEGLINGGVYALNTSIFELAKDQKKFSFETDIMESGLEQFKVQGFISEAYFIDIGIPEDYLQAQMDIK